MLFHFGTTAQPQRGLRQHGVTALRQTSPELVPLIVDIRTGLPEVDEAPAHRNRTGLEPPQDLLDGLSRVVDDRVEAPLDVLVRRQVELACGVVGLLDVEAELEQLPQLLRVLIQRHPRLGGFDDARLVPDVQAATRSGPVR